MFGVEFGIECFCGDSSEVKLDANAPKKKDAECDMQCEGNEASICGGCESCVLYSMVYFITSIHQRECVVSDGKVSLLGVISGKGSLAIFHIGGEC